MAVWVHVVLLSGAKEGGGAVIVVLVVSISAGLSSCRAVYLNTPTQRSHVFTTQHTNPHMKIVSCRNV